MAERITFHPSLYLHEAIEAAAAAYREHARIDVTSADGTVVVEISEVVEHDPRTVANAFCNHALYETIARRREATSETGA
jgi:hypothetical protein